MLEQIFNNKQAIKFLDFALEFNEPFGVGNITSISHKKGTELLQKFSDLGVITCINPDSEPSDKKYIQNQKSGIFNLLIKLDFEISTFALKQKRQKIKEIDTARQMPDPNKRSHHKVDTTEKKEIPMAELAKMVNPDM